MARLFFITHPEVVVAPDEPVTRWHLSDRGIGRMRDFARDPAMGDVTAIWASAETKAIEAAGLLAARLGCGIGVCKALGENDRSATGYLPPSEFERVADAFFASPETSIRGWERAVDAQARVLAAVASIREANTAGDIAVVAHGAVGALLLCAYCGRAITRDADQPFQGHYWTLDLTSDQIVHDWRPIG